ncbi:MAG TPA: 3-hydroxyacyl-ACP dehydratase FabZ family protein [Planctomycetota bacterium]|nr:3-hydroxyacyl-ACP dehydratase FabZ family protein [Planctomycetota bacterium]HRR82055.1 3-hydroxyacyl-ACP dehydratase FabZ family protein [Planctomycetota bacterium]HRT94522.1 3-hydroxyacyl-ACP dehydratase FabZ family protein [Planctomycetota bacterium]
MPKPPIVDPASIDTSRIQYDIEAIRKCNRQRFEMEQLTAIVHVDTEKRLIIAYKDVSDQEFWVRGHIPGRPLMPGVVMCEAVAQAASFLIAQCVKDLKDFVGFGGMDEVRFRGEVKPGDRFIVVGQIESLRRAYAVMQAQAFVGTRMVFEGKIIGVPM